MRVETAVAPAVVRLLEAYKEVGQDRRPLAPDSVRGQERTGGNPAVRGKLRARLVDVQADARGRRRPPRPPPGCPATLRRLTSTSLGHLICAERDVAASTVSATATPPTSDSSATTRSAGGWRRTEQRIAVPGGVLHVRPSRPRPAVCSSQTAAAPSRSPGRADAVSTRSSRCRGRDDQNGLGAEVRPSPGSARRPSAGLH